MTRQSRSLVWALCVLLVFSFATSASLARKKKSGKAKARDMILSSKLPEITPEELALKAGDVEGDAPAVILVDSRQEEWGERGAVKVHRVRMFQRKKILDESAVETHGDVRFVLYGGNIRVEAVKARTVLPDGTEIDASEGVHETFSESGLRVVNVAFPKVQVGAILDVQVTSIDDRYYSFLVAPRDIQRELPVLQSRFIWMPIKGLQFSARFNKIPEDEWQPEKVKIKGGGQAWIWNFKNIKPIPELANLPHQLDISQSLLILPTRFRGFGMSLELYGTWESWSEHTYEAWERWSKNRNRELAALAKSVTEGLGSPAEKASAIQAALEKKLDVKYSGAFILNDSTDAALESGGVTSGEFNMVVWKALEEVGVEVTPMMLRHRGQGALPREVPLPILINDIILRFGSGAGAQYWNPSARLPIGELPANCRGVFAVPLVRKGATGPIQIPDFKGTENKIRRVTKATLDSDGLLEAETRFEFGKLSAHSWKRRMERISEDEQIEFLEAYLGRFVGEVEVDAVEIAESKVPGDFGFTVTWAKEDFARLAGEDLLVPSVLFGSVDPADWADHGRRFPLDLGKPFHTIDTVKITLPEETASVQRPENFNGQFDPVGDFKGNHDHWARNLLSTREFRMDQTVFPAKAYVSLKQIFKKIAEFDAGSVVVKLSEAP